MSNFNYNRRDFLKKAGMGAAVIALPGIGFAAGTGSGQSVRPQDSPGKGRGGYYDYGKPDSALCGYLPDVGTRKKEFSFVVWGDPQVRETKDEEFDKSIALTRKLKPEFVISLGDQVHTPNMKQYRTFLKHVKTLNSPLYLVMGNHDWSPQAGGFDGNVYGKRNFGNHLYVQKQTGGHELICYSFDAGNWHLVIAPEPGHSGEMIDDYYEIHTLWVKWIKEDLRKNQQRQTMFFAHAPILPVGRRKFEWFNLKPHHRAELMDALTRYGNVKYAFSGHVHPSVAAMPHISWRYKGMTVINVANAGRLTRGGRKGGETGEDYPETVKRHVGVMNVHVKDGDVVSLKYCCVSGEILEIRPEELHEYDDNVYGFLRPDSELPAADAIINGDFERPLSEGWFVNHLFPAHRFPDTNPHIQKREIRSDGGPGGKPYLYLYTKANMRNSNVTSEARQAVAAPAKGRYPHLMLKYRILSKEYKRPEDCNGAVIVSGWRRSDPKKAVFHMVYSLGRPFVHRNYYRFFGPMTCLVAKPELDNWADLTLDIRSDYERSSMMFRPRSEVRQSWDSMGIDSLVMTLSSYNSRVDTRSSSPSEIGIGFTGVSMDMAAAPSGATPGFTSIELNPTPPGGKKGRQKGGKG
ncbi:MAG: metallophosphoesterase [Deltaproteobacteria bacterium]|nr:metallophosphoesterase [Deltaproteobacteria bacterium]